MEPETVRIYEREAREWARLRRPRSPDAAIALGRAVPAGVPRADIGCGPGNYTANLGTPVIAIDAAAAMLEIARERVPDAAFVRADLEAMPFRRAALGGGFARASYLHVPSTRLPRALAQLHQCLTTDGALELTMRRGTYEGVALPDDTFPGRFFASWEAQPLRAVVEGAGFTVGAVDTSDDWIHLSARAARTLPDFVGPDLRILMCGLNPSVYSADAGIGFARPGNRFWPAAIAAGVVSRDRDVWHALDGHGVGMTDLVKRATPRAAELTRDEYRAGAARVEALAQWLRPRALCFVGLSGYRAAIASNAQAGLQLDRFGGVPAYVMPSTSGLNAHSSLADLTEHLRRVAALADRSADA